MSFAKRQLEHQEQQQSIAVNIAVEAGVLERCEYHGIAVEAGVDPDPAYELANARFTSGALTGVFDDRHEMNDAIKSAIEDAPDECYECEHAFGDD
jgi:hypothetical protein